MGLLKNRRSNCLGLLKNRRSPSGIGIGFILIFSHSGGGVAWVPGPRPPPGMGKNEKTKAMPMVRGTFYFFRRSRKLDLLFFRRPFYFIGPFHLNFQSDAGLLHEAFQHHCELLLQLATAFTRTVEGGSLKTYVLIIHDANVLDHR